MPDPKDDSQDKIWKEYLRDSTKDHSINDIHIQKAQRQFKAHADYGFKYYKNGYHITITTSDKKDFLSPPDLIKEINQDIIPKFISFKIMTVVDYEERTGFHTHGFLFSDNNQKDEFSPVIKNGKPWINNGKEVLQLRNNIIDTTEIWTDKTLSEHKKEDDMLPMSSFSINKTYWNIMIKHVDLEDYKKNATKYLKSKINVLKDDWNPFYVNFNTKHKKGTKSELTTLLMSSSIDEDGNETYTREDLKGKRPDGKKT